MTNDLSHAVVYIFSESVLLLCCLSCLISFSFFCFSSFYSKQILIKGRTLFEISKFTLILVLCICALLNTFCLMIYVYLYKYEVEKIYFSKIFVQPVYLYKSLLFTVPVKIDLVGLVFSTLAYFVAVLSFLSLDTRFYNSNIKFIFTCNLLSLSIHVFTLVENYLLLFITYELLLIPSFLFVYHVSPGKRSIQASIYFVIWTQVGSFLVLLAVSYMISLTGVTTFAGLKQFNFTKVELNILFILLFFGFGFKVPI